MRDGQVVKKEKEFEEGRVDDEEYTSTEGREIVVGDTVKLRSFGSIGIVDSLKGDEAEVRVKSLRFREKLENLERVELSLPRNQKPRSLPGYVSHAGRRFS